jgi:DNA-binding MarR family transcriptional regulator
MGVRHDTQPGGGPATDGVDRIQQAWLRERPGTPVTSIGVITRIWRIGKILGEERRRTLARIGLDAATLDLLSTLRRAGPPYQLSPGTLARLSLLSAGAVSQRVARAERDGLVTRLPRGSDRRGRTVALTPAGHRLIDGCVDRLLIHEQSLLDRLTPEQQAQLAGLLRTLLGDLTARFGLPDRPYATATSPDDSACSPPA